MTPERKQELRKQGGPWSTRELVLLKELEESERHRKALQEVLRDTCGSVAEALGYTGPNEDGDALVAHAKAVMQRLEKAP